MHGNNGSIIISKQTQSTNVSANPRNIAIRLDQKGKPFTVQGSLHSNQDQADNTQHNLYDLSDNNQRIKTQAGAVRKRANYSQENLPSVEPVTSTVPILGNKSVSGTQIVTGGKKNFIQSYVHQYTNNNNNNNNNNSD